MPLGKNIRYRFVGNKQNGKRLAFKGNRVVEVTIFKRGKKVATKHP